MRMRKLVAVALTGLVLAGATGTAGAVEPPQALVGPVPADDPPGPEMPTKQNNACLAAGVLRDSDLTQAPPAEAALELRRARSLSQGAGVTVAVLDTGVSANPRLPNLVGGGDYVLGGGDGLADCDAHGTLIAGIIGAAGAPTDGFVGVAPDARVISIRVRSGAFTFDKPPQNFDQLQQLSLQIRTLARAITHAANLGAGVITVSLPICLPADLGVDQSMLALAIGYAVHQRGALIVTGAGDTGNQGCQQNPDIDPTRPADPRNWNGVKTIATPGWYDSEVLTVGFTGSNGTPIPDSLIGPWVSIAAPGVGVESLGPGGGGLINGVGAPDKLVPVGGASFAAAYVSGVAALVRSRYPNETPADVIARLRAGAHAPARGVDNAVGSGMIDPLAALSFRSAPVAATGIYESRALVLPDPPRPEDKRLATHALGAIVAALVFGSAAHGLELLRRRR
ncbi:type VII secretion-associated serine protease mycosin [Nocardia panacis]|uniref:Type VII secretion-associated serine protease mycosin n=1 Tax=Nocardia panacis TaxID=2340916 RepID=A0A3A4KTX3_9NOCA|nr:type VII secretion-associated serine protease mycosin [Nocardia panacis]RJO79836.1 type VII secretion-associated serine protease mycosin [Nocardia panacis]